MVGVQYTLDSYHLILTQALISLTISLVRSCLLDRLSLIGLQLPVHKMYYRRVGFDRARDFAAYWSSSRVANDIHLYLCFQGLRSRHIARFRGHESKVKALSLLGPGLCRKEADERLLWTLICNGSKLEEICVSSIYRFVTSHIHWCCYRFPVCESLSKMVIFYWRIDERAMAKLAHAVEQANVLTTFQINTYDSDNANITRLITGDNQLESLLLSHYCLNEVESLALLLAAPKKSQWKLLRMRPRSFGAMDDMKLLIRFLQVASKSSAQLEIYESSHLPNKSEVVPSKLAGVIIRS